MASIWCKNEKKKEKKNYLPFFLVWIVVNAPMKSTADTEQLYTLCMWKMLCSRRKRKTENPMGAYISARRISSIQYAFDPYNWTNLLFPFSCNWFVFFFYAKHSQQSAEDYELLRFFNLNVSHQAKYWILNINIRMWRENH